MDDLFGDVGQQKEHIEITRKLKEAKSNKTNSTFQILGRLIDPSSLDIVVDALRNVKVLICLLFSSSKFV